MRLTSLLALLFLGLIPLSGVFVSQTATPDPDETDTSQVDPDAKASQVDDEEEEGDRIIERIRLYLRRHGEMGRIDPERRLAGVREEYQRLREVGVAPQAIQGSNWISLGPTNGAGRTVAIAPHPTDQNTIYIGSAGGGVWKTTDGGASWVTLTDMLNDLSVGAVALAPSNPSIVYLGTGEGGYAGDFIPGIGFLKSTDGGTTWILPSSVIATMFYRILVNPTNPDELLAGCNVGALRSTDGGASWRSVISQSTYSDVTDLVRDPGNPNVLYATTWDAFRWCARSGSCSFESPRVLKSTDGGLTWANRSQGIPTSTSSLRVNRMSIAISGSNPSILYAATSVLDNNTGIEQSHIYKTTDGASSWTDTNLASNPSSGIGRYLGGQGWYDNTIVVSPTDPNLVIAGGVGYVRTTDGGNTWAAPPFTGSSVHVDVHDLRYQGARLFIANDGGVWSTPDNGNTSVAHNTGLVTRQYYAMTNDPANPNRVFGGTQDNGTGRRPDFGGTQWVNVIGADGFECGVSPNVPSYAFGTIQFGSIARTKEAGASGTPRFTSITPPYASGESGSFFSLLTVDQSAPATIYTGTNRVWRSTNGGDSWTALPTTVTSGPLPWTSSSITAIAVARSNGAILMVSKGNVPYRSSDGGNTWSSGPPPAPVLINNLEIDPRDPNIAYAAMAGSTRVSRTTDQGQSWSARSNGLPLQFVAQVVRVDPTDSNVLYCGTDVGVYRSTDAGLTWLRFGTGLPSSSVHDIRILEDGSIMRAATHGRGIWELEIAPTGNTPPAVSITPLVTSTVSKGTTIEFAGTVSDADGDPVNGAWTFPDTWDVVPVQSGATSASHTFNRAGVFPVTLVGRDSHGSARSAVAVMNVIEPADDCALAIVVPGAGSFPVLLPLSTETCTIQQSDPVVPCLSGFPKAPSIWLEFTPATTADYEFSTCGTSSDTVLSLWTGAACGPYTQIPGACNDDVPTGTANCPMPQSSFLIARGTAGETLRILATAFSTSAVGSFTLRIDKALRIDGVTIEGKKLFITGRKFQTGAQLLLNGDPQKTANDETNPTTLLIAKKAGKRITPGGTVSLQVRNPDGTITDEFRFTRPVANISHR